MDINALVVVFFAAVGAFFLWWLLVKGFRNNWYQSHEIKDFQNFGRKTNFNGIEMYGGDPELVSRVEKKLKQQAGK